MDFRRLRVGDWVRGASGLLLLVAWLATCGLVYVFGYYVGKGTPDRQGTTEERTVRLPVTSTPPPEGQRPKEAKDFPSFYQALPSGERPIDVARGTPVTAPPVEAKAKNRALGDNRATAATAAQPIGDRRSSDMQRRTRTDNPDTDDVWPRFERLAQTCKIVVDHGAQWRVDIRRRQGDDSLIATGDDLLKTVQQALAEAEKRGWHEPQ